jgi:ribosome-associated translation inhibitor RaiA
MKYMFVVPALTTPTFDTIKETVSKSFAKVESILQKLNHLNVTIRISVEKSGPLFEVKVEVIDFPKENPFIKVSDRNLRKAINTAAHKLKLSILNS